MNGLNSLLKDILSFHKLKTYSEVIDNALLLKGVVRSSNNIGNNNIRETNMIMYKVVKIRKDPISQGIKIRS